MSQLAKPHIRKLSDGFMDCLRSGFLAGITQAVRQDHDLNLEIRKGYLNIYFKGNSILKLTEGSSQRYKVQIHKAFTKKLSLPPELTNAKTAAEFVDHLGRLKQNVIKHGKTSLELEYEQMIIRANNYESRNNSEYFIIDRQYTVPVVGRFDLAGIYWPANGRHKGQVVDLCLMEVKLALNQDISKVHDQLTGYYEYLKGVAELYAAECESIFRQKLELGLYDQPANRLAVMKTLKISKDFSRFQFILVFVDYNPYSSQLALKKIADLPFANQVKVFFSGLALWEQNLTALPAMSDGQYIPGLP